MRSFNQRRKLFSFVLGVLLTANIGSAGRRLPFVLAEGSGSASAAAEETAKSSSSPRQAESGMPVLKILIPSEGERVIAPGRDFYVMGSIEGAMHGHVSLELTLADSTGKIWRRMVAAAPEKGENLYTAYADLQDHSKNKDDLKRSLMPDLVYDPRAGLASFRDAWRKIAFDEKSFTALVPGGAFRRDTDLKDAEGNPLETLPAGKYTIEVKLLDGAQSVAEAICPLELGRIEHRIAGRFSPKEHLEKLKAFAKEKKFHLYMDPFPGNWFPDGLLPAFKDSGIAAEIPPKWRFADAYEYDGPMTSVILYNITKSCATYNVEIGRLYSKPEAERPNIDFYYYDIGDAVLGKEAKEGHFVPLDATHSLALTRADKGACAQMKLCAEASSSCVQERMPQAGSAAGQNAGAASVSSTSLSPESPSSVSAAVQTSSQDSVTSSGAPEESRQKTALPLPAAVDSSYDPALLDPSDSDFDLRDGVTLGKDQVLYVQGVIAPPSNTPEQVTQKDDQTYQLAREAKEVEYQICVQGKAGRSIKAPVGLLRHYGKKEQLSLVEFRHALLFTREEQAAGRVELHVKAFDNFGAEIKGSETELTVQFQ